MNEEHEDQAMVLCNQMCKCVTKLCNEMLDMSVHKNKQKNTRENISFKLAMLNLSIYKVLEID